MRARRSHIPQRDDIDSFDLAPPEFFDAPSEVPLDEPPMEVALATSHALTAPLRVCLACGDDPSNNAGCAHHEVATITALSSAVDHAVSELRAQHDAVRDALRGLRRLTAALVAAGDASVEVFEPPTIAPRVVLVPPPARRPRRAAKAVSEQRQFGFVEPAPSAREPEPD
jgi:hypothetical protein